jgi:proteic killer suppression protein
MIVSFSHKGLKEFYETDSKKGIQPAHAKKLGMILDALDSATSAEQLNLPGFGLHPLKGDMADHWSIWVNGNWRVTFRFKSMDVELVGYQDYH